MQISVIYVLYPRMAFAIQNFFIEITLQDICSDLRNIPSTFKNQSSATYFNKFRIMKSWMLISALGLSISLKAQIHVSLGAMRSMPADGIFGFNGQRTIKPNTKISFASSPGNGLVTAMNQFGVDYLRYPGTMGNFWDWQKGDFNNNPNSKKEAMGAHNSIYDLQKFVNQLHPKPQILYNLNVLTDSFASQIKFMKTAQQLGLGVKYAELGAEFYLQDQFFNQKFPTGADYGKAMIPWCDTMKKYFPDLKLAIVNATLRGDLERRNDWNNEVLKAVPQNLYDAVTYHFYEQENTVTPGDVINDAQAPGVLAEPFRQWHEIQPELKKVPKHKEIWITEFNQDQNNIPSHGSWMHGLYCASQCLLFMSDPRTTMILLHAMIGSAVFGAIYENEKGFDFGANEKFKAPPKDQQPATVMYGLSAVGQTLKLFEEAERGMTQASQLIFSPSPMITSPSDNGFKYPALIGEFFSNGSRKCIYVLNLDSKAQDISIPANIIANNSAVKNYYDPPSKYIVGKGLSEIQIDSTVTGSKPVHLPPYSVTTITEGK